MPALRNIFLYPIEAINSVRTNIWSVLLIAIGSMLVLHGKDTVGGSLVTGGFALLRSTDGAYQQAQVKDPNAPKE